MLTRVIVKVLIYCPKMVRIIPTDDNAHPFS